MLKESDPDGTSVPMLMPAATDDRLFVRFGIQNYGSLPMLLPETLVSATTIHGPDERVPADTINFGQARLPTAPKVWTLLVVLPGPCLSLFDVV